MVVDCEAAQCLAPAFVGEHPLTREELGAVLLIYIHGANHARLKSLSELRMIVPLSAPHLILAFLCLSSVLPHDLDESWLARNIYFVVVIGSTYIYVKGSINFYGVLWTRTTIKKAGSTPGSNCNVRHSKCHNQLPTRSTSPRPKPSYSSTSLSVKSVHTWPTSQRENSTRRDGMDKPQSALTFLDLPDKARRSVYAMAGLSRPCPIDLLAQDPRSDTRPPGSGSCNPCWYLERREGY